MSRSLKETNFHGTPMFPLQIYSHKDMNGFYSVTAHWHEELEFLYIEEGTMHGIISGTPYEMKAGEFYFINSGELHELSAHNHSLHHAIVFDPQLLNFDLYDACQHNFIQPITQKKLLFPNNISSALSQEEQESLRQLFLELICNSTTRNNVHFSKLRSVFYRFWNSVSAQKFLYRTRLPESSSPP